MKSVAPGSLEALVLEICQHPVGSLHRQRLLTQVIRQMQRSGKIWFDYSLSAEQYQEALQRTWIWFCHNLHHYDPTQATVMTWFNSTLKFRIKDVRREAIAHQSHHHHNYVCFADSDDAMNVIDQIPAPAPDHSLQILAMLRMWLEAERSQLEQKTVRKRPDINAYTLMVARMPDQASSWQELSAMFGVAVPTLSSFYQRQCVPLLREFGRSQGWVDSADAQSPLCL